MIKTTGILVTLEGIEGVGKSTQLQALKKKVVEYREVVCTREPGGTNIGEKIRDILLQTGTCTKGCELHPDTELLLLSAARAQHWQSVIKPALAAGKLVISDRFFDSSYAYQGGGREIAMARIQVLTRWVLGEVCPHLTVLLDLTVEQGLERIRARESHDHFERNTPSFFDKVRRYYHQLAKTESHRYLIVDAAQEPQQITAQIVAELSRRGFLAD